MVKRTLKISVWPICNIMKKRVNGNKTKALWIPEKLQVHASISPSSHNFLYSIKNVKFTFRPSIKTWQILKRSKQMFLKRVSIITIYLTRFSAFFCVLIKENSKSAFVFNEIYKYYFKRNSWSMVDSIPNFCSTKF